MKGWNSLPLMKLDTNSRKSWCYTVVWPKEDGWAEEDLGLFWFGKYRR